MIIQHTALAALLLQLAPAAANSPAAQEAFDHVISQNLVNVSDQRTGRGSAKLTIMPGESNVQNSNFDWRTSQIENTGSKRIAAVYIDLSTAMFPDIVIDSDGSGGDDVAKPLSHDWGTTETNPISIDQYQWMWQPARSSPGGFNPTASFDPRGLTDVNNLFVSELSDSGLGASGGYRGELMIFQDFDFGETYEFSGDMDPNSLAGLQQGTAAIHAEWDVGGVSGAEISNSVVTLLFGDGTTASGTIAPDGSQAGAIAIISDDLVAAPGLDVDGFTAGSKGSISTPPSVVVSGRAGDKVRVTMMSAFDPVDNQEPLAGGLITAEALVTARLESQYPYFPVNNARLLQHVEVEIPRSGSLDITGSFQFTDDPAVGFTAVIIDAQGEPLSSAMDPIRLLYTGTGTSCPDDRKPDLSGYCVQNSCNANFICPNNAVRKDGRNCYDTFNDCNCESGYSKSGNQCVSDAKSGRCPSGRKEDRSGYCVLNSCNANYNCPSNAVRKDGRNCYDTFNDCDCVSGYSKSGNQCVSDAKSDSCPSGRKEDGSGYCVQSWCNANYQCPADSSRLPGRNCYDTINDCVCDSGFSKSGNQCVENSGGCPSGQKRDGSGYCVQSWCNANFQCPSGRKRRQRRQCYDTINDCERD